MNSRTMAALLAIPALVEIVETNLVNDTPAGSTARAKPSSKPPMSLGIVSDLDEAFTLVANAARSVSRHADVTAPQPFWGAVCSFLTTHIESVESAKPEAADWGRLEENINAAYDAVVRFAIFEERAWRPIQGRWTCPSDDDGQPCPGQLIESTSQRVIRCPICGRRWEGDLEYERLGHLLGVETQVTLQQAAILAKVSLRTVERWIKTDRLPAADVRGRRHIDTRDLAVIAARREAV